MIDPRPAVSVIVLTYNHEHFISEAIESVIRQKTNFSFEVVVANDSSTDSTERIVADYRARFPELIRGYNNEKNMGGASNFVKAYGECRGSFIAICEGDDYWTDSDKLQKQVNYLQLHPEFVASFHDAIVINSEGAITEPSKLGTHRQKDIPAAQLQKGGFLPTASVLFRPVIVKFPDCFHRMLNTDTFLWALLGGSGGAAFQGEVKPSVYRVHAGGIYSGQTQLMRSLKRVESMGFMENHFANIPKVAAFYKTSRRKLAINSLKLIIKSGRVSYLGTLFKYTFSRLE